MTKPTTAEKLKIARDALERILGHCKSEGSTYVCRFLEEALAATALATADTDDVQDKAKLTNHLITMNAQLANTLQMIVDADWRKWEELASPDEFVRWAKSRANHALTITKSDTADVQERTLSDEEIKLIGNDHTGYWNNGIENIETVDIISFARAILAAAKEQS